MVQTEMIPLLMMNRIKQVMIYLRMQSMTLSKMRQVSALPFARRGCLLVPGETFCITLSNIRVSIFYQLETCLKHLSSLIFLCEVAGDLYKYNKQLPNQSSTSFVSVRSYIDNILDLSINSLLISSTVFP